MSIYVLLSSTILLSTITVFKPAIFSKNIKPISNSKEKGWVLIGLLATSIVWVWYTRYTLELSVWLTGIHVVLIQIAAIDGYSKIIPNRLLVILLLFFIGSTLVIKEYNWQFVLLFWVCTVGIQVISRKIFAKSLFGWGDVKLLLVLALIFQTDIILILIMGIILAGLFSMGLLIKKSAKLKQQIPLAPFFVITILLLSRFSILSEYLMLNADFGIL